MEEQRPRVLDLFCGAGGLSLGFEIAGFDVLAGVDRDEDYLATYAANHADSTAFCKNLHEVPPIEFFEEEHAPDPQDVDVVVGGPPCKGFSVAGRREDGDKRDTLVSVFLDYVEHVDPEFVVMENVEGIRSKDTPQGEKYIEMVRRRLIKGGYVFHQKKLNAADFGVPQRRERVFVIAHRPEYSFEYPPPTHTEDHITAAEALNDVDPDAPNHKELMTNHSQDTVAELRELDYGESRYDNYTDSWRRIEPERPAPTIKENHGAPFVHPHEPRVGTVRECAKLQSFPDDYVFKGSKSKQLKQVGNAVPPQLASSVAEQVLEFLEGQTAGGNTTSHYQGTFGYFDSKRT